MRQNQVLRSVPVVILLAVLVGVLASQADAVRGLLARPTSVGTIDLGRVLEQINARAEWDASIRSMEESLGAELQARQADATSKKDRIDAEESADGAEPSMALREQLARELLETEVWVRFKQSQLDRERALMWQSLYRDVRAQATALAEAEGIDLLLVNDSVTDIQIDENAKLPAEGQVLQQITARRVLYSIPTVDLTDKLIIRMNNAAAARP